MQDHLSSKPVSGRTLAELLAWATGCGLARLDAQLLLLHALTRPQTDRAWLLAHDGEVVSEALAQSFESAVRRRAAGEPLAYVVGQKEFFGLQFEVDSRVLIPRPDTETLVNWALEVSLLLARRSPAPLRVLDLGTGSGAIAISLAHGLDRQGVQTSVTAVDTSGGALAVAEANATRLGPLAHVELQFLQSDWFEQVVGRFDLILSNPPYVADGDRHLADLTYEPLSALASGADGLRDLQRIVETAPAYLQPGASLLLEHGHNQASAVSALLVRHGLEFVENRLDLAGIARCSGGRMPG